MTDHSQSLTKRTTNGMAWLLSSNVIRLCLNLVFISVLARFVTPEEYGVVGIALVLASFASIISDLGISQTIIQKSTLTEREISAAFWVSLLFGIGVTAIVFLIASPIGRFFSSDSVSTAILLISFIFTLRGFSNVAEAILHRELNFRVVAIRETVSLFVTKFFVAVPLAVFGWGYLALVASLLVSEFLRALIFVLAKPHSKSFSFDVLDCLSILRIGVGFSILSILNRVALNIDNLVAGRMLGLHALGMYGRAYQLVAIPAQTFGDVGSRVLFPAISSIQNDTKRVERVFFEILTIVATVLLPASIILLFLGPTIIHLVLGPTWQGTIVAFQILSLGIYFRLGYKVFDLLMKSLGKIQQLIWLQLNYMFIVVLGSVVGSFWGLAGLCCGVFLAISLHYLITGIVGLIACRLSFEKFLACHYDGLAHALLVVVIGVVTSSYFESGEMNLSFTVLFVFLIALVNGLGVLIAGQRWIGVQTLSLLSSKILGSVNHRHGVGNAL